VVELEEFHKVLDSKAPGSSQASTHTTTWDVMMAGWAATMLDGDWAMSLIIQRIRRGGTHGRPASEGRPCLLCLSECYAPPFILAPAASGSTGWLPAPTGRELVDKLEQ